MGIRGAIEELAAGQGPPGSLIPPVAEIVAVVHERSRINWCALQQVEGGQRVRVPRREGPGDLETSALDCVLPVGEHGHEQRLDARGHVVQRGASIQAGGAVPAILRAAPAVVDVQVHGGAVHGEPIGHQDVPIAFVIADVQGAARIDFVKGQRLAERARNGLAIKEEPVGGVREGLVVRGRGRASIPHFRCIADIANERGNGRGVRGGVGGGIDVAV